MTLAEHNTLCKEERACGKVLTTQLFEGDRSRSMAMFPIRMVYMITEAEEEKNNAKILISVPKRLLRHAVDRNRVKRQIRESFRKNKHIINDSLSLSDKNVVLAFIWIDKNLHTTHEINEKVVRLLKRLEEKL